MTTTLGFKDIIDLPLARFQSPAITNSSAGKSICCDYRNSEDRSPHIYYLESTTLLARYHIKNDGWQQLTGALTNGTIISGAGCVFVPTAIRGTVAAGCTSSTIVLSTALPGSVGPNQLANRGDGIGFKVRIIGNESGGAGLTEERLIVANTGPSTTPTLTLDSALTFTPGAGAAYELLSGRVYILGGGTIAAGYWRWYDVATNTFSGNLSVTNLPATIGTDSTFMHLSELYVPYNRSPGDGFFGNLTATSSGATSLTGQAASGDAGVLANEYRNFQIRIVNDASTPTAAGQRRRIISHTAGASPVYTVAAWSVQPSANATYVIENWDDNIFLWTSGQTQTYTYSISGDAWSASGTFAAPPAAHAGGLLAMPSYGIVPDAGKNARNSYVYVLRGTAATMDLFDISGAATGAWTSNIAFGGKGISTAVAACSCYAPATQEGRYHYISRSNVQDYWRFDVLNRSMEPWSYLRYSQSTAVTGSKMASTVFIDGATKVSVVSTLLHTSNVWMGWLINR
jgi:hypothetical protein